MVRLRMRAAMSNQRKMIVMDTVRHFRMMAKKMLTRPECRDLTLQQRQHQVALQAGYASWSALLTAEQNADDFEHRLTCLMIEFPQLHRYGADGENSDYVYVPGGGRPTRDQVRAAYVDRRADLREHVEVIRWVAEWMVSEIAMTKTVRPEANSYGLKHIAEDAMFYERRDLGDYVGNGEAIAAAMLVGFTPRKIEEHPRNVSFNMSMRDINRLRAERRARSMDEYARRQTQQESVRSAG